jgi:hypothetical protein
MKPDRAIELTSTVMKLKRLLVVSFCLLLSVSVAAQETPPQGQEEPEETQEPQTYKEQYEKYQKQAKKTIEYPWFVGVTASLPSSSSGAV